MKSTQMFFCLLAIILCGTAAAQNDDIELHIPVENDNQFPPDNHLENEGIIEGSGTGVIEEPIDSTTEVTAPPELEEVEPTVLTNNVLTSVSDGTLPCPNPCVCNTEGDSNNYVVNCAGYDLTEFPTPLDPRTTTLNLQKNKLTVIPKEVSALKNLEILNADDNSLMELAPGSISELPNLVVLKLANNRLIEYPQDLKNSFGLAKLEELDLGGNDMRTTLTSENFLNFKSLRKLILPATNSEMADNLCGSLSETLEIVCTESCSTQSFECPNAPETKDDLLDATLPATIALSSAIEENVDPAMETLKNDDSTDTEDKPQEPQTQINNVKDGILVSTEKSSAKSEFSFRSAINKEPEGSTNLNSILDTPKEVTSTETDVKVGATTSDDKNGGVNKSTIGIIVAGMVLVVAGITIKKNWSSIKKRFSSTPRAVNERVVENTNGTTPEEVPLQDKSPV